MILYWNDSEMDIKKTTTAVTFKTKTYCHGRFRKMAIESEPWDFSFRINIMLTF